MTGVVDGIFDSLVERYPSLAVFRPDIVAAYGAMERSLASEGKLLLCGNGGSAADAEHISGELMKSFKLVRPVGEGFSSRYRDANGEEPPAWLEGALPAIPLVSHSAAMTAFSNDRAAEGVFAQQVLALGREGDVLVGISTSGNSANVVAAAKVARALGMGVVALTGERPSALSALADACVRVPEVEVYRIQELHLPVYHALCAALEERFFGEGLT